MGVWGTSKTYMGTFDLLIFNVILGSFGAIALKWPVTGKRLTVERNRLKFGIWGAVVLDLLVFNVILGSTNARVSNGLHLENGYAYSKTERNLEVMDSCNMYVGYI